MFNFFLYFLIIFGLIGIHAQRLGTFGIALNITIILISLFILCTKNER